MRSERPDATVLSNPGSDRVRAVRRLSGRSARRREGRFVAEGPQAVTEAVAAHGDAVRAGATPVVLALYATQEAAERYGAVLEQAGDAGCAVRLATSEVLAAMADTVTPQGLLAVCALVDVPLDDVVAGPARLVAVLAHVRDPGNAGTVLRAADAAGADGRRPHRRQRRRVQPQVRARQRRQPVPPPGDHRRRARRHGGGAAVGGPGRARRRRRGRPATSTTCRTLAGRGQGPLAGPVAWVFGNEAWGLPDDALAAGRRRRPGAGARPGGEPQPRHRRHGLPLRGGPRPPLRCLADGETGASTRGRDLTDSGIGPRTPSGLPHPSKWTPSSCPDRTPSTTPSRSPCSARRPSTRRSPQRSPPSPPPPTSTRSSRSAWSTPATRSPLALANREIGALPPAARKEAGQRVGKARAGGRQGARRTP